MGELVPPPGPVPGGRTFDRHLDGGAYPVLAHSERHLGTRSACHDHAAHLAQRGRQPGLVLLLQADLAGHLTTELTDHEEVLLNAQPQAHQRLR
jgi:hypothetical protein